MSWRYWDINSEGKVAGMSWRAGALGLLLLFLHPTWVAAADGNSFDLPIWTAFPFASWLREDQEAPLGADIPKSAFQRSG